MRAHRVGNQAGPKRSCTGVLDAAPADVEHLELQVGHEAVSDGDRASRPQRIPAQVHVHQAHVVGEHAAKCNRAAVPDAVVTQVKVRERRVVLDRLRQLYALAVREPVT